MDISLDISRAEQRLRLAGIPMRQFCKGGGIDQATWWRWKNKGLSPRLDKWQKIMAHLEKVAPEGTEAAE